MSPVKRYKVDTFLKSENEEKKAGRVVIFFFSLVNSRPGGSRPPYADDHDERCVTTAGLLRAFSGPGCRPRSRPLSRRVITACY